MSMLFMRWLKGREENRNRDTYVWNSVSGLINALQSTFILFFLQRLSGTEVSGVFTIAFATANLMLIIGKYGVRYFQVSDAKGKYTFDDYVSHRVVTSLIMLVVSVVYCVAQLTLGGYTREKMLVCLLLCIQKLMDSIEDVFYGRYHQCGRLDMAGKAMSVRLAVVIVTFVACFILTRQLSWATLASIVTGTIVLALLLRVLSGEFGSPRLSLFTPRVRELLVECFPLFSVSFMQMFIINVPKLVIDARMTSSDQAVYGFISMPVFIVSLLAEFFFRPMTNSFTEDWWAGRMKPFVRRVLQVIAVIVGITAVCIAGGLLVGIPVMSFLFKYPLDTQRLQLSILLLGSGMLSVTAFLAMILTIMRKQKEVLLSYVPSAAIAIPACNAMVGRGGLTGAALSYFALITLICLFVIGFFAFHVHNRGAKQS